LDINTLYLLLAVPFLAFIIAFFRQVVGITSFGVFAPLMLALSFFVLGLKFGMIVFMVVLIVSYAIRFLFEKVELLYIPKISLLLSLLALSFYLVLGMALYFGTSLNLAMTIFPMMIMATVSEKFLSAQASMGIKNALIVTIETIIMALLAFGFAAWDGIRLLVLSLPELIFVPIIGTIWLGKFTGLRFTEYFKFRSLFSDDSQE